MDERELLHAYGYLPGKLGRHERSENVIRMKAAVRRIGYVRCSYPSCVTLIALLANRRICRFHIQLVGDDQ